MKIAEKKHIGVILAITTLFLIFISNGLFYMFDIGINLSINGLPFYLNCILFIIIVLSFLLFKTINKRLIFFIISVFLLQNVFISGLDDLLYRLVGFDSNREGSFVLIIPITIIGIIMWGMCFDYKKTTKKSTKVMAGSHSIWPSVYWLAADIKHIKWARWHVNYRLSR